MSQICLLFLEFLANLSKSLLFRSPHWTHFILQCRRQRASSTRSNLLPLDSNSFNWCFLYPSGPSKSSICWISFMLSTRTSNRWATSHLWCEAQIFIFVLRCFSFQEICCCILVSLWNFISFHTGITIALKPSSNSQHEFSLNGEWIQTVEMPNCRFFGAWSDTKGVSTQVRIWLSNASRPSDM